MKVLVVATNHTSTATQSEILAGRLHRLDYLELANDPGVAFTDWNSVPTGWRVLAWLESKLCLDLRQAYMVAALVRQSKFQTVLSLSERVGIPLVWFLPRHVRHIVYMHHPLSRWKLLFLKLARIPARWHVALTLSEAERRAFKCALRSLDVEVQRLRYHVDAEFFAPEDDLMLPPRGEYLLSVGLSHRDYATLLRAMRLLPDVPARCFIGSNWVSGPPELQGEVPPSNVTLHPYVPPHELREVYRSSRFLVVPLQPGTQWSAGCTTVLQAQAMGKPVIASRLPGIADYLIDGETGLLVEPGDHAALAAAITTLWQNPDRVEAMGRRARQWVAEHFTLERWLRDVGAFLSMAWQGGLLIAGELVPIFGAFGV